MPYNIRLHYIILYGIRFLFLLVFHSVFYSRLYCAILQLGPLPGLARYIAETFPPGTDDGIEAALAVPEHTCNGT